MSKVIYAKLAKVQAEQISVVKDSKNPHFKSKYADINEFIDKLRPALVKHGLLVLQPIDRAASGHTLRTIIACGETGETLEFTMELPVITDPQKFGSLITYLRRYALQSLFFLDADDEDAEVAMGRATTAPAPKAEVIDPKAPLKRKMWSASEVGDV